MGIYLPGRKQDAVLRGDLSNTVVHPFFIHAMAALGMHLCAGVGNSPEMVQLHAKHSQQTLEQIIEISGGNDADLAVHALLSLAAMDLYTRQFDRARRFLTRSCIALNAAKLRFAPAGGCPLGLTEDVRERLVVLSQIIYLENYLFLAIDGTEPRMAVRVEKEFRCGLQVMVCLPTPRSTN